MKKIYRIGRSNGFRTLLGVEVKKTLAADGRESLWVKMTRLGGTDPQLEEIFSLARMILAGEKIVAQRSLGTGIRTGMSGCLDVSIFAPLREDWEKEISRLHVSCFGKVQVDLLPKAADQLVLGLKTAMAALRPTSENSFQIREVTPREIEWKLVEGDEISFDDPSFSEGPSEEIGSSDDVVAIEE